MQVAHEENATDETGQGLKLQPTSRTCTPELHVLRAGSTIYAPEQHGASGRVDAGTSTSAASDGRSHEQLRVVRLCCPLHGQSLRRLPPDIMIIINVVAASSVNAQQSYYISVFLLQVDSAQQTEATPTTPHRTATTAACVCREQC